MKATSLPSFGAKPTQASDAALTRPASPLTHPAHATHDKAQRVRGHAQKERGFKEHLGARQRGELPESAGPADEQQAISELKTEAPAKTTQGSAVTPGKLGEQPEANVQNQAQKPEHDKEAQAEAGKDATKHTEAEPFVQEVVAQVMEQVDPALRPKPAEIGKAATSVSGNTAAAMRSIGVEDHAAQKQGAATTDAQANAATTDAGKDAVGLLPVDADTPDQPAPVAHSDPRSSGAAAPTSQAPSPSSASAERAQSAINTAATATSPGAAPSAIVEPKLSLTPTLTAVSLVAPSLPGIGQASSTNSPQSTTSSTPATPPPAQQVQQAFEVAMRDLPVPAGERLVTLKMNPASLGSLRIALHVSGETVHVRFQVGSAKARAAIDESMDDLKASIGRQGLRIASVEVEEDRALAAPGGVSLDEEGRGAALPGVAAAAGPAGKGFAQLLDTPPGPEGAGAGPAPPPVRTTTQAGAGDEGGVLQVLTFRLDAVG